jgi:hypothetical protein
VDSEGARSLDILVQPAIGSSRLGRFLIPYLTLRFIADSLPRLLSISY